MMDARAVPWHGVAVPSVSLAVLPSMRTTTLRWAFGHGHCKRQADVLVAQDRTHSVIAVGDTLAHGNRPVVRHRGARPRHVLLHRGHGIVDQGSHKARIHVVEPAGRRQEVVDEERLHCERRTGRSGLRCRDEGKQDADEDESKGEARKHGW